MIGFSQKNLSVCAIYTEPRRDAAAWNKVYRSYTDENGDTQWVLDSNGNKLRLEHPRWRLILMQGIIDHVVGATLHKGYTDASVGLFQAKPDSEATLSRGFGVGFSEPKLFAVHREMKSYSTQLYRDYYKSHDTRISS